MNGQGLFYDDPARSPAAQHRQVSRQAPSFDSYPRVAMGANSFYQEEPDARFNIGRGGLGRLDTSMPASGGYSFDNTGSQTWNPSAFDQNGFHASAIPSGSRTTRPMQQQQQNRRQLPSGWMPDGMLPQMNNFGSMGPPAMNNGSSNGMRDLYHSEVDEELIPTAIVIKNIPFAVRKEELVDVMTNLNLPLPYAFNYHFDNGVFRGLAFANFTSAEETGLVIEALNHFELNGRKLRVEYKKMLPVQERERIEREKRERRGQLEEQHRPMATPSLHQPPSMSSLTSRESRMNAASPSPVEQRNQRQGMPMMKVQQQLSAADTSVDLNDPNTLAFYNEILLFKGDHNREMLVFPSTLTAIQRRTVHTLAHMMNLGHQSTGSGEQRQVYVNKGQPGGSNVSPPLNQAAMLQPDANRRTLNRAATTDFSEARGVEPNPFQNISSLRGQHSTGYLNLPESPGGFGNSSNLRGVRSVADLRSFTPSPAPSTASYPVPATHGLRMNDGTNGTPTLTPTTSNNPLQGQQQSSQDILGGFAGMNIGSSTSLNPAGSPRRLRGVFSWDREQVGQGNPSPAPIGSNRNFGPSASFPDDSSSRMPIRQPRGPAPERAPGFARGRNGQSLGHQQRGSDELSQRSQQQGQTGSNVEIIVEH